jgi:hypothetical protein
MLVTVVSTLLIVVGLASSPVMAAPASLWTNAEAFGPEAVPGGTPGNSQDVRVIGLGDGSAMAVFRSEESGYSALKYSIRSASGVWSASGFVGASNGGSWSASINATDSPGFDIVALSDGSVLLVAIARDNNFTKAMYWVRYANNSWGSSLAQVDAGAGANWGDCDGECLVALPNNGALLAMSDNTANDMTYTAFDGTASSGAGAWGSRVVSPYVVAVDSDNLNALALGADGRVYIAFSANVSSRTPSVTRVDPVTLVDDTPVNLSTLSSFSSEPPALVIPPGTSDAMVAWKENNQAYVSQFDATQSFSNGWSTKAALAAGSERISWFPSLAALPDGRIAAIVDRETSPNSNNYRSVQVMLTTGPASGGGPWPSSWTEIGDVSTVVSGASVAGRMSLVAVGNDLVGVATVDNGGQAPSGILGFGLNGSTGTWSTLTAFSTSSAQFLSGGFQKGVGTALTAWQGVPITSWQAQTVLNSDYTVFGSSTTTSVVPPTPTPPPSPVFPPSAPRDVTGVPGDRSVAVSWREPASSGSFPVSTYKATASPGGASCITAMLSCTVSGLTNGTLYTFTVEALNGAGWGPSGGPTAPVTPGGVTPAPAPVPLPGPLAPAESLLQTNGVVDPDVEVDPNTGDNGLVITGDGWSMDLDGLGPDGKPLNLGPDGSLRLANERDVATEGTGFLANSEVDLYVDPPVEVTGAVTRVGVRSTEAIYVGTVRTDARGNFTGTATLPEDIEPGAHVLQAVGYSPVRESRAMSLGVIVEPWIVLNQGTRKADGRHDRIRTTGSTGGIEAGTRLTPFIRYSGQNTFSQGKATITVQSDGSFKWTRQIRKNRGLTGYVAWTDVESNRVFWAKVR